MHHPVKIQPIDLNAPPEPPHKIDSTTKPILLKSRFKRLFERQFLRTSALDKLCATEQKKDVAEEFEPSSVCLTRMVENFIEESNEKPQQRCGRNRCNCFNGDLIDTSDHDSFSSSSIDACEALKCLIPCLGVCEMNLLSDTVKIIERNKIGKNKDGICRKIVADDLIALGYKASICKSEWEKSPSYPAGKYEYIDVIIEGERLIVDIDFRSEFEIARSTKAYKLVLQTLPNIFIGKADRLESIIDIVSSAAKQSLKKKGMPVPPWRKADYVKAKWLSPFTRIGSFSTSNNNPKDSSCDGEFELVSVEKSSSMEKFDNDNGTFVLLNSITNITSSTKRNARILMKEWKPPEIRPKSLNKGVKIVTGLASVIADNP